MNESGDRLTGDTSTLTASGWTLLLGASSSSPQSSKRTDIFTVCSGAKCNRPARGILAVVAHAVDIEPSALQAGHLSPNEAAPNEAAHVAIHLLVEGYFGAAATLSTSRAAALALTGANSWMFSQSRIDRGHNMRAALAALIFAGRRVGIVNVGDCRVYRIRDGQLTPMTSDHTRPSADGTAILTRSVGGDAELHIDYSEDEPQRLDRYIILSKGAYAGTSQLAEKLVASASPETVAASLTPAQHASDRAQEGTSLVIEIAQIPEANFDELSAAFEKLPLRRS